LHNKANNLKDEVIVLYRPTGPDELSLVKESEYKKWQPRLPQQPIFYPVTNLEYAEQIAREWNVKARSVVYATKFYVKACFIEKYQQQKVGGATIWNGGFQLRT
jgi:hypothetical protein